MLLFREGEMNVTILFFECYEVKSRCYFSACQTPKDSCFAEVRGQWQWANMGALKKNVISKHLEAESLYQWSIKNFGYLASKFEWLSSPSKDIFHSYNVTVKMFQ